ATAAKGNEQARSARDRKALSVTAGRQRSFSDDRERRSRRPARTERRREDDGVLYDRRPRLVRSRPDRVERAGRDAAPRAPPGAPRTRLSAPGSFGFPQADGSR